MGKIWVEIHLISARGLPRSSSFMKRQWFAVGWIDPDSKYCTKVDDSGNENPVWRTKFAILVDDSETNVQDLALNVEVYSMDPIFLTEKIHGSATIILKEFLAEKVQNSEALRPGNEEVRSYQLRKKDSSKPRGFVDISIRISEETEELNSYPGKEEKIVLLELGNDTHLTAEGGSEQPYSQELPLASLHQPENQVQTNLPSPHPMLSPANLSDPYVEGASYPAAARTPSPPPPPSNVGYIPTFLPRNDSFPPSYINMPSSGASPTHKGPPGFTVGALAAGAVIFGDDFMSGFDVPPALGDDSFTIATDPRF